MIGYGKKYFSRLRDVSGNTFSVNLNKLNYSGTTTEILGYSLDPARLIYRGGKDQIDAPVFPSEFNFSFFVFEGEDYTDILESNYKDYNLEVVKYSAQEHDLIAFEDYSNYGTGATWVVTGDSSYFNYDFNTNFDGWFNSAAGGGTPSTGGTTSNWVWSTDHGGSLKNTTVNSFPTKILRLSTLNIPSGPFSVKLKYQLPTLPNSGQLEMNFLIRNSSNTTLYQDQFAGIGGTGSEQEHTLFVTGDMSTADHFLITVASTSFVAGDACYINDITIIENINASVNLSGNQTSKYLRADLAPYEMHNGDSVFYNIRYTVTPTTTTGAHKLYLNYHNASGTVVDSHLISDQVSGGTFNPFNPYADLPVTTDVKYLSLSVACTTGHAFNFNVDAHFTTIRTTSLDFPSLYWTGWVHPENISSRVISGQYFIDLQATDGLLDLQQIEFPYSLYMTTGLTSVLQLLKYSLNGTGIALPIKTQINTTEASITGNTLLRNTYANPTRFVKYENGRITFLKAYDAISYLLDPFNLQLFQSDGYWTIIQRNEIASPQTIYDWDTLGGGAGAIHDRTKDISSYKFVLNSDELSKIEPLKYQSTTFFNLNSGSYVPNYTINGAFSENISGWFNGDEGTEFADLSWEAGRLKMYAITPTHDPMTARKACYSNTFNLNSNSGSTVTVGLDVNLSNVIFTGTTYTKLPKVRIALIEDEGLGVHTEVDYVVKDLSSGFTVSYLVSLRYQNTNLHYVEFYIEPTSKSHYNTFTCYFDNVTVFRNNDASLTYDQLYRSNIQPLTTAVKENESKIYFGDSLLQYDAGGLMNVHSGLTTSWTAYSGSTGNSSVPLVTLYNYNLLKLSSKFKDYIRINLASQPDIFFDNLLKIDSKRYAICSYDYSLVNNRLQLELVDHLSQDKNVYTEQIKLSSVDGNPLNG